MTITIHKKEVRSLMLCIAGAWLYGTISRGRAHELAKALGKTAKDIDDLKFVEERILEQEKQIEQSRMTSAAQNTRLETMVQIEQSRIKAND